MKTRIRKLRDGKWELIRLLSPEELDSASMDDPLTFEKSIVWLEDISQMPFVRVKRIRKAHSRRGPIYLGSEGRVVGYSKLTADAPRDPRSNGYTRRVFYRLPSDESARTPSADDSGHAIVDPTTVLPGVLGEQVVAHASRFENGVSN